VNDSLDMMLRSLKLPGFARYAQEIALKAERESWSFLQFLNHLTEMEVNERSNRRIERYVRQSELPSQKTLSSLEMDKLPEKLRRQLPRLCEGGFVDKAQNILAFGLPGRGKTHIICALGYALIDQGYQVLFAPTYKIVQKLLAAKQELRLEKELKKLDRFDAVILDDIGYVQQNRDEMEVLFTFLAERYERKSVMITSNLVFSQWDRIFKDKMTTAAAIDRLVHHSIILEVTGPSYRNEKAKESKIGEENNNGYCQGDESEARESDVKL
jgi:DNA replication protein DnaC